MRSLGTGQAFRNRAVRHYRLAGCLVEGGRSTIVDSLKLAMAAHPDRVHRPGTHSSLLTMNARTRD